MKILNLLISTLTFLLVISCNDKRLNKIEFIDISKYYFIENGKPEKVYDRIRNKKFILTFINGDCGQCISRISDYVNISNLFKDSKKTFFIVLYSENRFSSLDTISLIKKYSNNISMILDGNNNIQIKNKLARNFQDYSICVDDESKITKTLTYNELIQVIYSTGSKN